MLTGSQLGKGKIKNNSALQPLRREATHAERQKQPEKNVLIIRQCETSLGMNNYSFSEKGGFIGRQSNNDIIVNDNYVSRRHAEIVYKDENYFIRDLASSTGTFIKVTEKQPVLNV